MRYHGLGVIGTSLRIGDCGLIEIRDSELPNASLSSVCALAFIMHAVSYALPTPFKDSCSVTIDSILGYVVQ